MAKQSPGNGSGKFAVHQQDMGGWVRVFTDRTANVPDDLPVYLALSLATWLRQRPQLRLKTVVPITRNGDTVELHAWFEVHILPEIAPAAPPGGAAPT